jgi:hypothetical protein
MAGSVFFAAIPLRLQKPDGIFRGVQNRLQNAVHVVANLAVPEAQHRPALSLHERIAFRVMSAGIVETVLVAVKLDDEPRLDASEVGHIRSDRMLAAEAKAAELAIAQADPEPAFGFRHGLAKGARLWMRFADRHGERLTPSVAFGDTSPVDTGEEGASINISASLKRSPPSPSCGESPGEAEDGGLDGLRLSLGSALT